MLTTSQRVPKHHLHAMKGTKEACRQYHLFCSILLGLFVSAEGLGPPRTDWVAASDGEPACDILVLGGSASALASAITAAEAGLSSLGTRAPRVCLTEPTDWLGGQLTASGVSAIDFGNRNRLPAYQAASFRDLISFLNHDTRYASVSFVPLSFLLCTLEIPLTS